MLEAKLPDPLDLNFTVFEPVKEPFFRYIPDRSTIQRLLNRVSNMKDDLSELGIFD